MTVCAPAAAFTALWSYLEAVRLSSEQAGDHFGGGQLSENDYHTHTLPSRGQTALQTRGE